MILIHTFSVITLCLYNANSFGSAPIHNIQVDFAINYNKRIFMTALPAKQQLKAKLLTVQAPNQPNKSDICYPICYDIAHWNALPIPCKKRLSPLVERLPQWMPQSRLDAMNDANTFQYFLRHQMPYTEKTAVAIEIFSRKTRLPIVLEDGGQQYRFVLTWRQPQLIS